MKRVRKGLLLTWPWLVWRERQWDVEEARMRTGPHQATALITTCPNYCGWVLVTLGRLRIIANFHAKAESFPDYRPRGGLSLIEE